MKIINDEIAILHKTIDDNDAEKIMSLMNNEGFKKLGELIRLHMNSRKDAVFLQEISAEKLTEFSEIKGALREAKFIFKLPENIYKLRKRLKNEAAKKI